MKLFSFPSYDRNVKDDAGRPPVVHRAWYIAMMAASQAPSGPTAERSSQVNKIYNAIKSLMKIETTTEPDGKKSDDRFLNPEGGTFVLEDAEVKVLKEIIDNFRNNVSGAGADALVFIDELIANAPEQAKAVN